MNIKYIFNEINWIEIQKAHDDGLEWSNIKNQFKVSYYALEKAEKLGLLNSFSKSHT